MSSHLIPFEFLGSRSIVFPPEQPLVLPYPEPEWYLPGDPIRHTRKLRLTRGMHLLNEWWRKQNVYIKYHISQHDFYLLDGFAELQSLIRELHRLTAPHQNLNDKWLIFGIGATQVIHAALYAQALKHSLCNPNHEGILYATQRMPGYFEDATMIEVLHRPYLVWIPFEESSKIPAKDLLEFVTTPNNPDGSIRTSETNASYTIYDRVNHWRLFLNENDETVKTETLDEDQISIFSLSKFLSFSGSRLGYGFVDDEQKAHWMRYYIIASNHGLVSDSHIRCAAALKYLLDGKLESYVEFIRNQLKSRWQRLIEAVKQTELKLLNNQGPAAWISTPHSSKSYLDEKYAIEGTYGHEYGASESFARLNMLSASNEFDEFIWRLEHLS